MFPILQVVVAFITLDIISKLRMTKIFFYNINKLYKAFCDSTDDTCGSFKWDDIAK